MKDEKVEMSLKWVDCTGQYVFDPLLEVMIEGTQLSFPRENLTQ